MKIDEDLLNPEVVVAVVDGVGNESLTTSESHDDTKEEIVSFTILDNGALESKLCNRKTSKMERSNLRMTVAAMWSQMIKVPWICHLVYDATYV